MPGSLPPFEQERLIAALAELAVPVETKATTVNAEQLRLLVESARIRLACVHDKHFAVSLCGTCLRGGL
ncbi:MAG: hypothetical protein KGS61_18420, partial [Verrucomicrobia bacterium]|nr:hypothetical protein [Verrucomicrobiota bacterium]